MADLEVKRLEAEEAEEKKPDEAAALTAAAPAAVLKLAAKGSDVLKLFVPEMRAIAHVHFMQAELKGKKAARGTQLQDLIAKHPTILPLATAEAERNAARENPPSNPTQQAD